MTDSSEHGGQSEDQCPAFVAFGVFDAERRRERRVKSRAKPVVALQIAEPEIGGVRRDLPRIIENRGVEEAIDHDPPLPLHEQTVPVAKAPARETTQIV